MSVSALLGTAIGLIFVFALVSLFCSAITESVSNLTEKRARYLLTGLRSMLDHETSNADVTTVQKDQATSVVNAPSADTLHEDAKDVAKTTEAATQVMAPHMTIQPGNLTLGLFGHPLIRWTSASPRSNAVTLASVVSAMFESASWVRKP